MTTKYIILIPAFLIELVSFGQQATGKLKFDQGQQLDITLQVKTTIAQQAMGQTIDFTVDATGIHTYKVTNTTDDNTTLKHQLQQVKFAFDGMGQKKKFDSKDEKDINGQFGKPIKELLDKKFDVIVDANGKTLMAVPEKIVMGETDSRMAVITSMMKEVTDLVQPPQKGKASFFQILPERAVSKGDNWTESYINETGKFDAAYAITEINDSVIVVDFAANSITVTKAEMMGSETTTTLNNKSTGKIIVDRATGIMREKTSNTESTGNTEAPFGTLPVTSKTSTIITVNSVKE
jgi:Family of unknown function (DUF6263)